MDILEKLSIDTPQEFVLLFVTLATEMFIGYMIIAEDANLELLFMNPLISYWIGLGKGKAHERKNNANNS